MVGFDDYLAKPIKRSHFITTIAAYLGQDNKVDLQSVESTFDEKEFEILKNNYIETLIYEVAQLKTYAEELNYQQVARISHMIKGTAGNFNLSDATTLATTIENLARKNQMDENSIQQLSVYTASL